MNLSIPKVQGSGEYRVVLTPVNWTYLYKSFRSVAEAAVEHIQSGMWISLTGNCSLPPAMIEIACPQMREELDCAAHELKYI